MSKAGYHWKPRDEDRPVPCFICATEPRLEGHSVCSGCHRPDEENCLSCHPERRVAYSSMLTRGVLASEAESGRII